MDFEFGQVVISKAGRDKGKTYMVDAVEGEYLFLVDGEARRLDNPKKKKMKHVQPMHMVLEGLKAKHENEEKISNAEIRNQLFELQQVPRQ
ncbi:RNA-binding protein [Clostridiales bacterium F-3ap]|uniref:RNA-binding protein n=2 Tax=Anaerotalea alkaliphila TaxID=2662126 RepID=A0A7X5HWU8_9FIRM|nr:RNA-binding protein [Anaerotalea alkaliphila]